MGYVRTAGMSTAARRARRRAALVIGLIDRLGTEGTAWDIGYAALYLCSDEARWVTGIDV